jgi:hypothetical protein
MFNTELAELVIKQIEADPELWRQEMWATQTACGTALCFAGWTAVLSGYKPVFHNGVETGKCIGPDDREHDIANVAYELLDIPDFKPNGFGLFAAENNLDDIKYIVAELNTENDQ